MTAQPRVNVEKAKDVRKKILLTKEGKTTYANKFQKADKAVTLAFRSTVKVDPQLLFQRLLMVRDHYQDVQSLFEYELCRNPAALFESACLPLHPKKSVLAETLWKEIAEEQRKPSISVQYVFDDA